MTDKVFTFWDGPEMPAYIKLCMDTWKFPYTLLNLSNLHEYTDLPINDNLKRFTLPQIADCIRVHVLRDQGGYWLDADTIMMENELPHVTIMGDPVTRTNSIGYLCADNEHDMFEEWARYQDIVINNPNASHHWPVMGNRFTDAYLKEHPEIDIEPITLHCPETYMVKDNVTRYQKYLWFYFDTSFEVLDFVTTNMIMLHNSWTPTSYKLLDEKEVLSKDCTLSNILRYVLNE